MNNKVLWFNKLALAACVSLAFGCDKSADPIETTPANMAKSSSAETAKTNKPATPLTQAEKEQLIRQYQQVELTIVDASEQQLDGTSTFVITFSAPLEPDQDFSQFVTLVDKEKGLIDGGWILSKNLMELRLPYLEPNRDVILTVKPNLASLSGHKLNVSSSVLTCPIEKPQCTNGDNSGQTYQIELKTQNILPMISFSSRGSLLPSNMIEGLPVQTLNVNQVDVNFYRVKPAFLVNFVSQWNGSSGLPYWRAKEILDNVDLVYSGRFELNPKRNQRESQILPIDAINELQEKGVYFAVMNQAGSYDYTNPATLFTISNMGLSAHRYQHKMAVFVQSLTGGSVLENVTLTLLDKDGKTLETQKTNEQGMAMFEQIKDASLVLADRNGETSLLVLNRSALDLTEFNLSGETYYDKQFFAFGPRDLYRPGETVQVNALLRDADGYPLPVQPIKVDVLKPDNQILRSFVWQSDNAGFYQKKVTLPQDSVTGKWALRFHLGDDNDRYYRFSVEDFLPERMAMEIKTPSTTPIQIPEEIHFDIKGWYLYGAPASNNALQGQLYVRAHRELAALPGFEIGNIADENLSRRLMSFETELDKSGLGQVTVPKSELEEITSPFDVILQASLLDAGGRPINRQVTQTVWSVDALPAIRPIMDKKDVYDYERNKTFKRATVDENSTASFDIAYINPNGEKLAIPALDVKLIKERQDYYWTWSDDSGWTSQYNSKDIVMARTSVSVSKDQTTKVEFPVEWGAYRLEVSEPNQTNVTSSRFWAGYSWQDNTQGSGAVRPDQVKLKLDKPAYRRGDTALVTVEAPTMGAGYLMVESNDGPLWSKEISVPVGGAQFEVPISSDWKRHDLYLNAIIVRPGDKTRQATAKRAVGLLHLPIQEAQRQLNFTLDAPERIRPNNTVAVKIKSQLSQNQNPEKVTVLLSAVDSGVLSITDFETPDPYRALLGRKRYAVDQLDVYGQIIEGSGKLGKLKFGGDSDDADISRGGKKAPAIVQIVAQQLQPVTLDKNGEGVINIAIPDFNGELRLMAQAWTESDFGKAEQKITVAAPLIAELSTPRFLSSGDSTTLTLDLRNLTGENQQITVKSVASGLLRLQDQDKVTQTVELKANGRQFITFPVTALAGFGQGELAVTVSGLVLPEQSNAEMTRRWAISVRPPYPATTRNYPITLDQNASWVLSEPALAGLVPETLEAKMILSARPPLNIGQYVKELYAYPYGCAEQTTSGLYPSLYTNQEQLALLGIKTLTDQSRREKIALGIERLLGMQLNEGGFGLWSNTSSESYWLTAYVTDFLLRARTQGYSVNENALNKALTRLQRYIQDPSTVRGYGDAKAQKQSQFAVRAYAAYVLAKQNKVSLSALRQLEQMQQDAISGLSLVQLGRALQIAGDAEKGAALIQKGVNLPRQNDTYIDDYGSQVRDEALILAILEEDNVLANSWDDQLLALSKDLNSTRYLSTQERNAIFMAGRHLWMSPEKPWSLSLNGQVVQSDKPKTVALDSQSLAKGLTLNNQQETKVYGRIDLTGYPINAPTPENHTLSISREFFDMQGNRSNLAHLKSGDLVFVSLHLTSTEFVPDALVVDLLPAGLELENQNLAKTSVNLENSAQALEPLIREMQNTAIKHQEYRDDRYIAAIEVPKTYSYNRGTQLVYLARAVTPGEYLVPPPYVESMYRPEWFAIGNTPKKLVIKP